MKEEVAYGAAIKLLRHHAEAVGLCAAGGNPAHWMRASSHTLRGYGRHGLC